MLNLSTITAAISLLFKYFGAVLFITIGMVLAGSASTYAADPNPQLKPEITRTNVERRINMAERLLDKKQYKEAVRNLQMTVRRYRYNADAWNLLGLAHRQAGDIDAANAAYTRALSVDRYHLGALEYQGELFISLGKLNEAEINLRLINDLCPVGCQEQRNLEAAIAAAK